MAELYEGLLSPSEALDRFQPASELAFAGEETVAADYVGHLERLRYGFRVGGVGLLIDPDTSSEIIEPPPVSPLPNTPAWLRGLINLRGNLIPVYDLVELLGLSKTPEGAARRMLILGEGERAVAVLSDDLPQVPALGERLSKPPPLPGLLAEHIGEAYLDQNLVWLEFHHHSFFLATSTQIGV